MPTEKGIGQVFKEIRARRGLAIEDVKSDLHQSTVSHFERNNQDIRLLNLIQILAPTLTSLDEFVSILDVKTDLLKQTMNKIQTFYDGLDTDSLMNLLQTVKQDWPENRPKRVIMLIIQSYIKELNNEDPSLSEEDALFIEDYLLADGEWYQLEYVTFANLTNALPFRTNIRIMKCMFAKHDHFHLVEYTDLLIGALYNLSVDVLHQQDRPTSITSLLQLLDTYQSNTGSLYLQQHIIIFKYLFNIINGNNSYKAKLEILLQATKLINSNLYEKYLDWITRLDGQLLTELAL